MRSIHYLLQVRIYSQISNTGEPDEIKDKEKEELKRLQSQFVNFYLKWF